VARQRGWLTPEMQAALESMGIVVNETVRVIIDLNIHDVPTVYVQSYTDSTDIVPVLLAIQEHTRVDTQKEETPNG